MSGFVAGNRELGGDVNRARRVVARRGLSELDVALTVRQLREALEKQQGTVGSRTAQPQARSMFGTLWWATCRA